MKTFWLCMVFLLLQFQYGISEHNYNNSSLCRQDQRQLLLQLSHNLHQNDYRDFRCDSPKNYYKTKHWNESPDCCGWDRVTCDGSTGFVVALDLSCGGLTGDIHSNSTLFRLTHLRKLNLAFNNFNDSRISSKFGWLTSLTHLNLSNSISSGPIHLEFYYLSNLISLDISSDSYIDDSPVNIYCDLKLLFKSMTKIGVLVLAGTNISSEFPANVSTFLTHLDLGWAGVHGNLQINLFERPNFQVLRLGGNRGLQGSLPDTFNRSNVHSFRGLDLSSTNISGRLPESIGLLKNSLYIYISECNFWGPIPESIGNITAIESMDMSRNKLSGEVPSTISNLRKLNYLYLQSNNLGGQFPDAFANLQNLSLLSLINNYFEGEIPASISNMSQLDLLDIRFNSFTGSFPSREYQPWSQLQNLEDLHLQSNELEGTFPSSLCNFTLLSELDLSNNRFRGKLPTCIGNSGNSLEVLTLSRNDFSGIIPTTYGNNHFLRFLDLSDNHIEGPLPRSLANCTQLELLALGKNMLHDTFPWWLQTLPWLSVLILKSNNFHGSISPPLSNSSFSELQIIDLSHNFFTGLLLDKFFATLRAMKEASHHSRYSIYVDSVTLSVKGDDREFTHLWPSVTTIDLSSNNFYGSIPESLAYLTSLWLLNLSHNSLTGSIPPAFGHLTTLEQLDLSSNQLIGTIPHTLTNLTFLEVLNLSYNHLVGPIPEGGQFSTFPRESYVGNLGLYGAPLTKSYENGKAPPSPTVIFQEDENDDDSGLMMGFTWQAVAIGYGCGVVIGFILGSVMLCLGKPTWFARFYYAEAANCLKRRKKRGRVVQGRR